METIFSLSGLPDVVRHFTRILGGRKVIALHGEMGAGKTTFVRAFCSAMGVQGIVNSPTFSLVNEYVTKDGQGICHMDWYRLNTADEVRQAGLEEYLYSGMICLVEWPERAPGLLPGDTIHAWLEVLDAETRRLSVPEPQS